MTMLKVEDFTSKLPYRLLEINMSRYFLPPYICNIDIADMSKDSKSNRS